MNTRYIFLKISAVFTALVVCLPITVKAQDKLPVVTTFSILGDMVERIGGNAVAVTTLVGRNGDTHVYQPTPADAKAVRKASILFTNGLEFEGWLDRLAEAAEFNGELVVTTDGIETITLKAQGDEHGEKHGEESHEDQNHHDDRHSDSEDSHEPGTQGSDSVSQDGKEHNDKEHDDDAHADEEPDEGEHEDEHDEHHHGEFDPHSWQSLKNAVFYVDNITAALSKASPENAATFYNNRANYIEDIESLDKQIRDMISALPASARTIVTSHDAFQYFGRDYGITFLAPQGLSTESEASARDVALLINQIRADSISAVFVENVADPRLVQQIARETGSVVGGKLFPGALSKKDGPASTYLDLMHHNATTIASALSGSKQP